MCGLKDFNLTSSTLSHAIILLEIIPIFMGNVLLEDSKDSLNSGSKALTKDASARTSVVLAIKDK